MDALKKAVLTIFLIVFLIVFLTFIYSEITKGKATITIDGYVIYQEIEGFGGAGAYYESLIRNLREPQRSEVLDLLFSELGINIYRLRVWTRIEPENDDNDPNNFNWSRFYFSSASDAQVWTAQQAKARGVTKFMASVWSPPGWMKNTGREPGGGYLLPEMYQEFAEFLAAYIIGYKEKFGIEIGWISIQNEPDFSTEVWETCTYTPEQMRDVIKVVGAKLRAEGLSTKIICPETAGCSSAMKYIDTVMADPEATQYVYAFAHHLYDINFFNPDEKLTQMRIMAGYASRYNRPLWQTEYSYLGTVDAGTFKEALATARHIHNFLTVENGSVYLVWTLFWYRETGLITIYSSNNSYKVNPVYYAVKQYSKFISPGSRRIYASSNISDLLVSAYLNEPNGNVTIVIINKGSDTVKTKIQLKNIQWNLFKQYRTSITEKCEYIGDIKESGGFLEITLPPESITTLMSYSSIMPFNVYGYVKDEKENRISEALVRISSSIDCVSTRSGREGEYNVTILVKDVKDNIRIGAIHDGKSGLAKVSILSNNKSIQVNVTIKTSSITLCLKSGYNLFSLPFLNHSLTASSLLELIGEQAQSIFMYNSSIQRFISYDRKLAEFGIRQEDFKIEPNVGYFIYVSNNVNLTIFGAENILDRIIPLKKGYNLIGWTFSNSSRVSIAFMNFSFIESVFMFDATTQRYVSYDRKLIEFGIPQPDFEIVPGQGYFVFSSKDENLYYGGI
ncbi:MAG: glycoside hydrolase [Candidatus Bathyarchaeia archaeon]